MTTDVARQVLQRGGGVDAVVATALAATAVGTASLGVALVIVGKLKLARFVSYLPMPVVSRDHYHYDRLHNYEKCWKKD